MSEGTNREREVEAEEWMGREEVKEKGRGGLGKRQREKDLETRRIKNGGGE